MAARRTSLTVGLEAETVTGRTLPQPVTFQPTSSAMRIWTITAPGATPLTTGTYGSHAHRSKGGLPITTGIGTISSLGDIPGWMTSPGALRHSTTAGG